MHRFFCVRFCQQCAANGRNQLRVLGNYAIRLRSSESVQKTLFQFWKIGKWSAAEKHFRHNVAPACQRCQNLHGYGVEYRCGYVGSTHVARGKVLNVGLGKHSAPRCDGVDGGGLRCQRVQLASLDAPERRRLVDECACAACATAVHANVGRFAFVEKDHFRILAAHIHKGVHLGVTLFDGLGGCHHFLHKTEPEPLGVAHAHRACQNHIERAVAQRVVQLFGCGTSRLTNVGVVSAIVGVE